MGIQSPVPAQMGCWFSKVAEPPPPATNGMSKRTKISRLLTDRSQDPAAILPPELFHEVVRHVADHTCDTRGIDRNNLFPRTLLPLLRVTNVWRRFASRFLQGYCVFDTTLRPERLAAPDNIDEVHTIIILGASREPDRPQSVPEVASVHFPNLRRLICGDVFRKRLFFGSDSDFIWHIIQNHPDQLRTFYLGNNCASIYQDLVIENLACQSRLEEVILDYKCYALVSKESIPMLASLENLTSLTMPAPSDLLFEHETLSCFPALETLNLMIVDSSQLRWLHQAHHFAGEFPNLKRLRLNVSRRNCKFHPCESFYRRTRKWVLPLEVCHFHQIMYPKSISELSIFFDRIRFNCMHTTVNLGLPNLERITLHGREDAHASSAWIMPSANATHSIPTREVSSALQSLRVARRSIMGPE